jgi:hypothetical protein
MFSKIKYYKFNQKESTYISLRKSLNAVINTLPFLIDFFIHYSDSLISLSSLFTSVDYNYFKLLDFLGVRYDSYFCD